MVIRRVEPLAAAKVLALVYVAFGLIMGVIFAVFGSLLGGLVGQSGGRGGLGAGFGVMSIIFMPILYGCVGFVMTLIGDVIYNWAASIAGGIQIQTD